MRRMRLPTPSTYTLYRTLDRLPKGRRIFSYAFSRKARFFRTIRPTFLELRPHLARVRVPDRKAVHNHIGTIHAIAVCNGLEAAMGGLAEATVPTGMRWLPKRMEVDYLAKASSDLVCIAETTEADWACAPDVPVRVRAIRTDGTVVAEGVIRLWVTEAAER
jgi:acyl-coenzyme A thioesterase PaaI-like protein